VITLDDAFLADVHLEQLSPEEGNLMLAHIYETLEMRVGLRLASAMEDYQLDEFETFMEEEDDDGALSWLSQKFPNYRAVVETELELLRAEIRQMAPAILSMGGAGDL
jgi:hypothetical protein